MRLCTYRHADNPPRPGRVEGDRVEPLEGASLLEVLASEAPPTASGPSLALADVALCAPIPEPPTVRDFYAFEQHVVTARANRGATVPAEWYSEPVFYFPNPAAVYGPEETIPHPLASLEPRRPVAKLDYELEIAAVIGRGGEIAGFTIMNDWSARDLQAGEVPVGLGPAT
jgi:fumarylacetoacetate (FAA) hydrolase